MIDDKSERMYGTLCAVSADNPAIQALGGFKESCAASKYCRHCMADQDDLNSRITSFEQDTWKKKIDPPLFLVVLSLLVIASSKLV